MSDKNKRDARWVKSCLGLHEGDVCDENVRRHARKQMDDEGGGERDAREGRGWGGGACDGMPKSNAHLNKSIAPYYKNNCILSL